MSKWDVHRDADGNPVTLTEDQVTAVLHALAVRAAVAQETNPESPLSPIFSKSRLLGRMLIDGRPPLDEAPDGYLGARGYHLAEPDERHFYLHGWPE